MRKRTEAPPRNKNCPNFFQLPNKKKINVAVLASVRIKVNVEASVKKRIFKVRGSLKLSAHVNPCFNVNIFHK